MTIKSALLLMALTLPFLLIAQEESKVDHLYLYGNNFLKGQIKDTLSEGDFTFILLSGKTITLNSKNVNKHTRSKRSFLVKPGEYFYPTKGLYFYFGTYLNIPLDANSQIFVEKPLLPFFLQLSGGYRFNNFISLGISAETDFKNYQYLPIGLELKVSSSIKKAKPIFILMAGRNFYLGKPETPEFYFKPADLIIFPSFGFCKSSNKIYSTELTVGIKAQLTNLKYKKYNIVPQPIQYEDPDITKVWDQFFIIKLGFTF